MTIHVLCIDDQLGRSRMERDAFLSRFAGSRLLEAMVTFTFATGQIDDPGGYRNDVDAALSSIGETEEKADDWNLILLDMEFLSGPLSNSGVPSGQPGDELFGNSIREAALARFPDLPIVVLSAKGQVEIQKGPIAYLSKKGLDEFTLRRTLLRHGRLSRDEMIHLLEIPASSIVRANSTIDAYIMAFVHSRGKVPCMLLGETGTGKELLAKYIHDRSLRPGPFLAVNVSAIPGELVESELFGIENRTATGVSERKGFFEKATRGTLFLDEIGDLTLAAQSKLLRVLQEEGVVRVGGREIVKLDTRVITATSRDLPRMLKSGAFREDLYYRIDTVVIELPSLRERREEIPHLVRAFVDLHQKAMGKNGITVTDDAVSWLSEQDYYGNVRELESIVKRTVSWVGDYDVIDADLIRAEFRALSTKAKPDPTTNRYTTEDPNRMPRNPGTGVPREPRPDLVPPTTITELLGVIDAFVIKDSDESLIAVKPRMERAIRQLLQRAAGAAIFRCRDPVSGRLNRQRAMQLLTQDTSLRGKAPARVVNQLLGRPLDSSVSQDDLEELMRIWQRHTDRYGC